MPSQLENWALTERQFIKEEITWYGVGAALTSPSGKDVTEMKVDQLETRLEHLNAILDGITD